MTPTKPMKPDTKKAAAWITQGREELHAQSPAQRGIAKKEPATAMEKPKRERFTVNLDPDLIEWARRAVVHTPGLTLTGLVEEAVTKELERREKKQGEPFPETTARPTKGRPVTLKG